LTKPDDMTKFFFTFLLGIFFLFSYQTGNAQRPQKYCGQEQILKDWYENNPDYLRNYNHLVQQYKDYTSTLRGEGDGNDTTYTVQVVVHIVYKKDSAIYNIPDEYIYSQIEALNRDFNKMNEDTSEVRDIFKPIIGNPKIKFELAKINPQGNPTNGIERKKATNTRPFGALPLINANVKKASDGGLNAWKPKNYVNIWVCDLNPDPNAAGFLGGFAYAPPGLDNWPGGVGYPSIGDDGIVIDYRFFGQNNLFVQANPQWAPYSKGRTTVHECGHFLGLRHIWGDYGNLFPDLRCNEVGLEIPGFGYLNSSDGIDDTPLAAGPYANYETACVDSGFAISSTSCICSDGIEANTCNTGAEDLPDLFENFMDYSGDLCYGMFTKDQADFNRWVLLNKRAGVIIKREVEVPAAINIIRSNDNHIDIYPNPGNGRFQIDQQFINKGLLHIEVLDILGQTVYSGNAPANQRTFSLDLSGLSPAMYLITFKNEVMSTTERVVIE